MAFTRFQLKSPFFSHSFQVNPFLFLKFFSCPYSSFLTNNRTFSHTFQLCAEARAHLSGRKAHAQMLVSGFIPTTFVSNCLIHMYVKCSDIDHAGKVFDQMPTRDTVSWNAIIAGYASNGSMDVARYMFDKMPNRDTISWNSLLSGYNQNKIFNESINLFYEMTRTATKPDRTTFAITLKLCASLEDFNMGTQIHAFVVKLGLDLDVKTGSSLLDMYAKCGYFYDSVQFFYEMPNINWVSWSAIIAGCVQNEKYLNGVDLFIQMQRSGSITSQSAYASIFKSCASLLSLTLGKQFHAHALKNNYGTDIVVGTAIIDMYSKCNNFDDASRAFWSFQNPTIQSWNAIIVGFARNEHGFESINLFHIMIKSNVGFNEITLSSVFNACAEIKASLPGMVFHCLVIKSGFSSNICVMNAILDMYGKCKLLNESCIIFDDMEKRDSISWNAIITSLEQNGRLYETLLYFNEMLKLGLKFGMKPDEFTFGSVIKACAGLKSLEFGIRVHDKVIKSGLGFDTFISCALIDMYCKCGAITEAMKLHLRIGNQELVSWNAIISGFSIQKQSEEAQNLFSKMLHSGLKPDNFTYATVLDTCADLATAGLGSQLHAQILKQELHKDIYIASTLVDMYVKCGNMHDARNLFDKMPERDVVAWNAMICGYAVHGHGLEAINLFNKMQKDNINPNHATFVSILRACGHDGLYNDGMKYFDLMKNSFGLEPKLEHYSCMVDIIGRLKSPFKALDLINNMPFEPDSVIWRNLLSVCKIRGGEEAELALAEFAANKILSIDSEDSSTYVLLCNLYGEAGKWEEVSRVRKLMRENGLKKEPGCSWIEVVDEMHAFIAGDTSHSRVEEMYGILGLLIGEMKRVGYNVVDLDSDLNPLWNEADLIGLR